MARRGRSSAKLRVGGLNSTQLAALMFLLVGWIATAALPGTFSLTSGAGLAVLFVGSAAYILLALGVLKRWRWVFWLLVVLGLASAVQIPADLVQLSALSELRTLLDTDPTGVFWPWLLQALVRIAGVFVGLVMLIGFFKAGVWEAIF